MALTYAFSAVAALDRHADDLRAVALDYDARVANEADDVYRESAAADRARIYRWRDEPIPDWDVEEMERQALFMEGVGPGSTRDPVLGRAFLRRTNLLDAPGAIFDAPEVRERALRTREIIAAKPPVKVGPTRAELLSALAAADPSRHEAPALEAT
jgi:hypothetical protein